MKHSRPIGLREWSKLHKWSKCQIKLQESESLDEKRLTARQSIGIYKAHMVGYFDKKVCEKAFKKGESHCSTKTYVPHSQIQGKVRTQVGGTLRHQQSLFKWCICYPRHWRWNVYDAYQWKVSQTLLFLNVFQIHSISVKDGTLNLPNQTFILHLASINTDPIWPSKFSLFDSEEPRPNLG